MASASSRSIIALLDCFPVSPLPICGASDCAKNASERFFLFGFSISGSSAVSAFSGDFGAGATVLSM